MSALARHRKPSRPKDARDAVPRRLSKWHRSFLDGDILLKWTPYSQERLGPVLLFAQNSKVPVISFERPLVLSLFRGSRTGAGGRWNRKRGWNPADARRAGNAGRQAPTRARSRQSRPSAAGRRPRSAPARAGNGQRATGNGQRAQRATGNGAADSARPVRAIPPTNAQHPRNEDAPRLARATALTALTRDCARLRCTLAALAR